MSGSDSLKLGLCPIMPHSYTCTIGYMLMMVYFAHLCMNKHIKPKDYVLIQQESKSNKTLDYIVLFWYFTN